MIVAICSTLPTATGRKPPSRHRTLVGPRNASPNVDSVFTDTFVRRSGRWQCVAHQATNIAEPGARP